MRSTRKLRDLLHLVHAGAGENGIYALAAAARRPYRRVHAQVQRLAAAGVVSLNKQHRGPRARIRVRPAVRARGPTLTFNRAWSRPSGGLDAATLIAQVLARPTFRDVLACVQHYGIEQVRGVYGTMVSELGLAPGAATASARMLTNIELGRARAAGIH